MNVEKAKLIMNEAPRMSLTQVDSTNDGFYMWLFMFTNSELSYVSITDRSTDKQMTAGFFKDGSINTRNDEDMWDLLPESVRSEAREWVHELHRYHLARFGGYVDG